MENATNADYVSCGYKARIGDVTEKFQAFIPSQHIEIVVTKSTTSPRQIHLCHSNGI